MVSSVPKDDQRVPLLLRLQRHLLLQRHGRRRRPEAVRGHEHLRHAVRRHGEEHPLRGTVALALIRWVCIVSWGVLCPAVPLNFSPSLRRDATRTPASCSP